MDALKNFIISQEDDDKIKSVVNELREEYKNKPDPWGFNLDLCEKTLRTLLPFYRHYFKVRVFGAENIKDHAYMVVSNHTGQIPIDGMLINIAFALEASKPRVLRVMVERFLAQLPFLGELSAQVGAILGDRSNCQYLLDKGESILVFPEGVRGIAKNTPDFYKVKSFSQGFYRIALQKKTPILPVCVIGAEEMFPLVMHARSIAKLLRLPALPLSTNLVPLPSPIDIYIGEEIPVPEHLFAEASDKEVREHVFHVENTIRRMIVKGLKNRRPFFDLIRKPVSQYMIKEFNIRSLK
jgi:1-acyl-sn-glycerol-3-phosphate acyltransferase